METADSLLKQGRDALLRGEVEAAEAAFTGSLKLEPRQWQAHYNLGELYQALGLPDEARAHYAAAVQRGPERFETWNGLGLSTLRSGAPQEAATCFLRALCNAPGRPEPLLNLALTYARMGMTKAAARFASFACASPLASDLIRHQAHALQSDCQ